MKLAVVLGAGAGYSLFESRRQAAFWEKLSPKRAESLFPALTCPVQATLRTASLPNAHGMIASGYFDRALQEPFFWKQPSTLSAVRASGKISGGAAAKWRKSVFSSAPARTPMSF